MTTYDFFSLSGQHLGTFATSNPDLEASELAHHRGIDPDEVIWEVCPATDPDPFCMPALSVGDYDTTAYESQFV